MRRRLGAHALAITLLAFLVACSPSDKGQPVYPSPDQDPAIVSLEVLPMDPVLDEDSTLQLSAVGVLADETRVDMTTSVTWSSSDESVITVDENGLATGVLSGNATVTTTMDEGLVGAVSLEVYVPFTSEDGVLLRGRRFGDSDIFVVLLHMFPSDQTSWYPFAQVLADEGYTALTLDFRGYGVSEGERVIEEIGKDAKAAVDFVRSSGAKQVFLLGASMGGTASLKLAATESLDGVVAISAPLEFMGLDVEQEIGEVEEPMLIVVSEEDRSAAIHAARLYELARENKKLKIYAGSAHGTALLFGDDGEDVQSLLLDFLDGHSLATGG